MITCNYRCILDVIFIYTSVRCSRMRVVCFFLLEKESVTSSVLTGSCADVALLIDLVHGWIVHICRNFAERFCDYDSVYR